MACVQGLFACGLSISFIWSLPSWSTKGKWKKTQNGAVVGFECFAVFLPEAISFIVSSTRFSISIHLSKSNHEGRRNAHILAELAATWVQLTGTPPMMGGWGGGGIEDGGSGVGVGWGLYNKSLPSQWGTPSEALQYEGILRQVLTMQPQLWSNSRQSPCIGISFPSPGNKDVTITEDQAVYCSLWDLKQACFGPGLWSILPYVNTSLNICPTLWYCHVRNWTLEVGDIPHPNSSTITGCHPSGEPAQAPPLCSHSPCLPLPLWNHSWLHLHFKKLPHNWLIQHVTFWDFFQYNALEIQVGPYANSSYFTAEY